MEINSPEATRTHQDPITNPGLRVKPPQIFSLSVLTAFPCKHDWRAKEDPKTPAL